MCHVIYCVCQISELLLPSFISLKVCFKILLCISWSLIEANKLDNDALKGEIERKLLKGKRKKDYGIRP